MVELKIYAAVLVVTSLVTATPSGYDVRGGAFAGAHASAGVFGGFGEIPLSIPSAGSYSSSFSKSLSSSHASSSASSSSSSFSFSGNGHIPNAIGSDGSVIPGTGECSSGSCQTGIKGAPGYGTGGTGIGANAAAVAGAGTFVGSTANSKPCTTGDCSSQNQGCNGPNCNYNLNKKKCTSGQCSPSGTAPTYFEDIPVTIGSSTTANTYNANEKPQSTLPTSNTYGCSNGNCGSASTPKPVYSQTSAGAFPSSSGPVNKPATHLTSPKEQAPCTSPNCGNPTGGAYDTENLPSSYTVPVQGSYTPPSSPEKPCSTGSCAPSSSYPSSSSATVDCASGNCNKTPLPSTDFNTKKPTLSTSQDDIPDFVALAPSASANCGTPNCVTPPAGSKYPGYLQQGSHSNTPTSSRSGSNLFAGSYDSTNPTSIASSVTEKLPTYTGGFGGPPGILKPNENSLPSRIPVSDYKPSMQLGSNTSPTGTLLPHNPTSSPTGLQHKPTYNPTGPSAPQYQPSPSTGLYKPPCSSGNCGNLATTPYPIYPPYAPTGSANVPSYKPTGPSACSSGNCEVQQLPCTTGNCGTLPQQPGYGTSASTGSYVPTICTPGNCASKPTKPLNYDNNPSGSYKPTLQGTSFPSSCSYGNCSPTQPGLLQGGPYESSSPTGFSKPLSCTSGNCGSQSSQSSNYGQAGTSTSTATGSYNNHGIYKPSTCTSGNCGTKPSQPLNYDNIPSGIYKPTSPGSSYPSSCSNGNCTPTQPGLLQGGLYESSSPTGFSKPLPCTSGNCGSQSSQSSNYGQAGTSTSTATGSYNNHGIYKPSTCTSGNCGTKPSQPLNYGIIPSGIYKPTSPGSSYPSSCSNGNCVPTQPGLSKGDSYEPTSPTGFSKPLPCTSGNCGSQSSQSSIYGQAGTSTSTASGSYNNHGQNKPTYVFGGSPGVLKPNDFGTPTASSPIDKPTASGSYNPTSCTSGNCGTQIGPSGPSSNGQYYPTISGSYNPSSCTYGNCGAQSGQSRPSSNGQYYPIASGSYNPTVCASGTCGHSPSQFGQNNGAHLSGSAIASASAGVYTGGFGGPPGLLKPYDDGKLTGNGLSSFDNPHFGNPPMTGINFSKGKSLTDGTGISAGAATQAKAFRGGNYEASDNGVSGCKDGCGSSGSDNYGLIGAAAKSQASAGAFGFGGSYASSSASAHASAGAVAKGGYGKR